MAKLSDSPAPNLLMEEILSDGSTLTNPAADYRKLFLGEDGALHLRDSAGTVTQIGATGAVETDAIFDAKGDLPVGTGADTAAKLAAGVNGTVPTYASGETTGMIPAYPPGYQLDYVEKTSSTTITATTEAGATTHVTSSSVTFDGAAVWVEYGGTYGSVNGLNDILHLILWDDTAGVSLGELATLSAVAAQTQYAPLYVRRKLTPAAGARVYSIRAYKNAGTVSLVGGAGGAGNNMPAYIRITKA